MSRLLFALLLGVPALGTALCALFRNRRALEIVTVTGAGLTFLAALALTREVAAGPVAVTGWWFADGLSAYVAAVVTGSALVAALYSVGYLRRQLRRQHADMRQLWLFYLLLNAFLCTMTFVLLANNIGVLWIGTEATTLATAFLVAFYNREASIEAAWKYVIICSVGIALALFGVILTYYSAIHVNGQSAGALNWTSLMAAAPRLDPGVLKLAFIFLLVGFGTKAGLAPMHTWKPDAYGEAPAPVSALMAAGLVNVALYSLMRFAALVNAGVGGSFVPTLFVVFGLVSMGVAAPFMIVQRDFKRLLAYSSVEHVGIIVFGLGIGTPLALFGALLHILNNALAKSLLFLTGGNIRLAYNTKLIRKVQGAIRVVPVSAVLFLLGAFAITGSPPFGVFVSEFTIAGASFASGNALPALFFIALLAVIFGGFIYYISGMVFGAPQTPVEGGEARAGTLLLLGVLLAALLLLGVAIPSALRECIVNAAGVLKGGLR
ncbi:MAG TPA: hydrogenase 4 subunit F [Bacteroidota bacterium]|nr:hydrogenase 4 subunit F [Bacteroidota bacterium]